MTLGEMVDQLIKKSGLSRTKFGQLCGVAQPRLYAIITGKTLHPRIDTLKKIADQAGVRVDDLLKSD